MPRLGIEPGPVGVVAAHATTRLCVHKHVCACSNFIRKPADVCHLRVDYIRGAIFSTARELVNVYEWSMLSSKYERP